MDRIGHCDPYIEIDKDGERIHTTQVLKKTSDAVWEDFPIHDLEMESVLTFTVKDYDFVGDDDFIGQLEITYEQFLQDFFNVTDRTLSL